MEMPGRSFSSENSRFGFNGYEKDNEVKGIGNSIDFTARMYDSRVGRFLSLDPLSKKFPSESNFIYAGNSPIYLKDVDGKYKIHADMIAQYRKDYPMIMKYLENQIEKDISNSTKIIEGLQVTNPNITVETIKGISKWGKGPTVWFTNAPSEIDRPGPGNPGAAGYTSSESSNIEMNSRYATYIEKVLADPDIPDKQKLVAFSRFYMTLIHETAHEFNKYGLPIAKNDKGNWEYNRLPGGRVKYEVGDQAEEAIWGTSKFKPHSNSVFFDMFFNNTGQYLESIGSPKYATGVTEHIVDETSKTKEGRASLPTLPTQ